MAVHVDRLERLAVMLDEYRLAPGGPEFDLQGWGGTKTRRGGFLWLQQVECGSAACAVGLACLSGTFSAEGLSYDSVRNRDVHHITPVFGAHENWEAVQAFFNLTSDQAYRLFDSDNYAISSGPHAARAVAARIRATIKASRSAVKTRERKALRTTAAVEKIKAAALGSGDDRTPARTISTLS